MSAPRPLELEHLSFAESVLSKIIEKYKGDAFEIRLQILESASARFGGFDLKTFYKVFGIKIYLPIHELLEASVAIVNAIERSPIPPALALSALARESLHEQDRKSTGAYHTDFRLAKRLAELAAPRLSYKSYVIDPACGAGILLAALTIEVCGVDRTKTSEWLAHCVCAADLSANSLRATLLSLASFTDDIEALKTMRARWYCGDSLMADETVWKSMAPHGFDAVIGNPPWEKVKLSKHEFLKSSGTKRHYGSKIHELDHQSFTTQRDEVASYSKRLLARYPDLGSGEPDLYIAFTSLFFDLCNKQGVVSALIPGGLIRSKGTQAVRNKILNTCQSVSFSIIDNRGRFFSIDTRFKFLAVALVKTGTETKKRDPIMLLHERGTPTGLETYGVATIGRASLVSSRPDLSLPEVRSHTEWKMFLKISEAGSSWEEPNSGWQPKFCREVDMSKERPKFLGYSSKNTLPLVEGRMVQAHRFGVKGYMSGTGRSALWKAYPIGSSCLSPQFWIYLSDVPRSNQSRVHDLRVGFCDIAGQTNERSLMASLIPEGVVCGNKVPTITFPEDPSRDRLFVWLAIANSFVFDWMLRRVLTTTVNYFLLKSIPLPRLTKDGLPWKKIANCAAELMELDRTGFSLETYNRVTLLRSEIDAEVAVAYGLNLKDMEVILQDFTILDRGQPPLPNEQKSTITRDTVLSATAKRIGYQPTIWLHRSIEARDQGAMAYVPSEFALGKKIEKIKGTKSHG